MSASRPRGGFVLVATSIALLILIALAGLAVDVGRMYVIKSELQAFADAAALASATRLDGSDAGLSGARQAALELTTGPNAMKWDLGTQSIGEFKLAFGADSKTWEQQPKEAANCQFVKVVATAPAPLIFLRPFRIVNPDFSTVAASSVATNSPAGPRLAQ